jgi:hypothetical protein
VCDQETSNEEAKAHDGAVENTTAMGFSARKTNDNNLKHLIIKVTELFIFWS